jgi:hypothetical protein
MRQRRTETMVRVRKNKEEGAKRRKSPPNRSLPAQNIAYVRQRYAVMRISANKPMKMKQRLAHQRGCARLKAALKLSRLNDKMNGNHTDSSAYLPPGGQERHVFIKDVARLLWARTLPGYKLNTLRQALMLFSYA